MAEREDLEKQYQAMMAALQQELQKEADESQALGLAHRALAEVAADDNGNSIDVDSNGEWTAWVFQTGFELGSDLDLILKAYAGQIDPLAHPIEEIVENTTEYLEKHGNVLLELLIKDLEKALKRHLDYRSRQNPGAK